MINNNTQQVKAYLAGVNLDDPGFDYSMSELAALAEANNYEVVGQASQKAENVVASTYLGKGKVAEIRDLAQGLGAKVLIVNDELTPVQIRNLEHITKLRVIDRTELILEIFSSRARTRQAKLQVELARLEYELPRLHPSENSLDQQRGNGGAAGGGGFANRGAGESKLELNRRTIGKQISAIKRELREVADQEAVKAARRKASSVSKVALVGYTNAGKSTTMNGLLREFGGGSARGRDGARERSKEVLAKDMLFATLDTAVRRIDLGDGITFILSDTVGFVSKLPHKLVDSFKATLQEAKDADLLINVVDASDPNMNQMIKTTLAVLDEIGITGRPMITAYNKADLTGRAYPQVEGGDLLYSAEDPASIKALAGLITRRLFSGYGEVALVLPLAEAGRSLAYLHARSKVVSERYSDDGVHVVARLSPADKERFGRYVVAADADA